MPYTIQNLISDVLPRIAKPQEGKPSGITVWGAANSISSLLFKNLLNRRADLISTGEMLLIIPAYDYAVPLPDGFWSMAEKPAAIEAPGWLTASPWMSGTVTSYNSTTKALVMNVTYASGPAVAVAVWSLAVGWRPGNPIFTVDTSVTSITPGTGAKTITVVTGFAFTPGQNVIISNVVLPTDDVSRSRLEPEYLDDDDHDDYLWWEEYKFFGQTWETATSRPRKYKIINNMLYVRPKVIAPVMLSGKYNSRPAAFIEGTFTTEVPWAGMFDEIYREGIVFIMQNGVSIPEANQVFMAFFEREFSFLINARIRQMPVTGRTRRSNFM